MNLRVSSLEALTGMHHAKRVARSLWSPESRIQAVMFFGQEGIDLEGLAASITQGWLCTKVTEAGPCGECASCLGFAAGHHVDVLLIEPRGQGNFIRVQDISGGGDNETLPLQSFVRTRPLMGRNKVVVMEQCHRLHERAANALLKSLEEPEPHVRLLLTTHYPSKVLATIRSRCACIACDSTGIERTGLAEALHPRVHAAMDEAARLAPHGGLRLSEKLRAIADEVAKQQDIPVRQTQAAVLQEVGEWLRNVVPHAPGAIRRVVRSHRLILGNANGGTQFDALFCSLLQDFAPNLRQLEQSRG